MFSAKPKSGRGVRFPTATALLLALTAFILACDGSPAAPVPADVDRLEVAPAFVSLTVGDTLRLRASAYTVEGTPVPDAPVSWWSGDASLLSVSPSGLVTALRAGHASVRAVAGAADAFADVTVLESQAPAPTLSGIAPAAAQTGSPALSLRVVGSGFTLRSRVLWGGAEKTTTFESSEVLHAAIGASDLAVAGTVEVKVVTPAPGGGASQPVSFAVQPTGSGTPILTSISPERIEAGSEAFTLTLAGAGFPENAVVLWNGSPRPTTRASDRELRAEVAVHDVWLAGSALVSVAGANGATSTAKAFSITPSSVTRIVVSPDTLRLNPFEEGRFESQLLDANGNPVTGRYVAWSISNGTIAQVFGDGSVRATNPGQATIRVANGQHSAFTTVVVNPHRVHYVVVEPPQESALVGDQIQFSARTYALGGLELHGRSVRWWVTDPAVATVDANGRVTARARGTTNVYAESEGQSNWAVLEVREWPTSAVWTFDLRADAPGLVPVGDTTWVDPQGQTQHATLYLLGATLTLDRALGTYHQTLRVALLNREVRLEDHGRFQQVVVPQSGLLFTSLANAGVTFSGRISGPGELLVEQKIRSAELRSYLYVVR